MKEETDLSKRRSLKVIGTAASLIGLGSMPILYEAFRNETDEEFIKRFIKIQTNEEFGRKKVESKKNAPRNPNSKLTKIEIEDIIWNIFNEADTNESEEGQLGILLSVIDRMLHKDNPATATGVIYKNRQYSWVDQRRFPAPSRVSNSQRDTFKTTKVKLFSTKRILNIKKLVDEITDKGSNTVSEVRENISKKLKAKNINLPQTPILFYKRYDWDHNDTKSPGFRHMSRGTIKMFTKLELDMKKRNESPIRIGSHVFYSSNRL